MTAEVANLLVLSVQVMAVHKWLPGTISGIVMLHYRHSNIIVQCTSGFKMRTETTHSLLPSQVIVQPVLSFEDRGVGQFDQKNRQQGHIRFVGYGSGATQTEPLYGPSGKQSQTTTRCGELVDIYV